MEDHHVDRSGVYSQQWLQLTDPNRSIELDRFLRQEPIPRRPAFGRAPQDDVNAKARSNHQDQDCSFNSTAKQAKTCSQTARQTSVCSPELRVWFAGLAAHAGALHPIPSRTRPLNPPAAMILRPKARESSPLPVLQTTHQNRTRPCALDQPLLTIPKRSHSALTRAQMLRPKD